MEKNGVKFREGEGIQEVFFHDTVAYERIPGDGKVYDGMAFMAGLASVHPNTMRIHSRNMVIYLVVAEQDGILYFISGGEIIDSKDDPDIIDYIKAVNNHLWKEMIIKEIK